MPELPEVHTITAGLRQELLGATIAQSYVYDRLRNPLQQEEIRRVCNGQTICRISRRAKFIRICFSNETGLILHLGMTGSFSITHDDNTPLKHERVAWILQDGRRWRFSDIRKFGALFLCDHNPELDLHPCLKELGPEPLDDAFTPDSLQQILRGKTSPVKNLIMDQKILVGVGNIYACEALFLARINPQLPGKDLTQDQAIRLHQAIRQVLTASIEAGGTTISDYRDVAGHKGMFVNQLQVYGKPGQPCPICGAEIAKITQGGRSTFFCTKCQK